MNCAVCKIKPAEAQHHYIPGANRHSDEYKGVKQKLIPICFTCHFDVHNLNDRQFLDKYRFNRSKFIFRGEKLSLYKEAYKSKLGLSEGI